MKTRVKVLVVTLVVAIPAMSRGPGRTWTFAWIFGLPGLGLAFHLWWCRSHGIDPLRTPFAGRRELLF